MCLPYLNSYSIMLGRGNCWSSLFWCIHVAYVNFGLFLYISGKVWQIPKFGKSPPVSSKMIDILTWIRSENQNLKALFWKTESHLFQQIRNLGILDSFDFPVGTAKHVGPRDQVSGFFHGYRQVAITGEVTCMNYIAEAWDALRLFFLKIRYSYMFFLSCFV